MHVVYSCYGGAHSSRTAAAIHLGRLPVDRVPGAREILAVPGFDRVENDRLGIAELAGVDDAGHRVYVLGRGPRPGIVERAFQSGFRAGGGDPDQLLFVNTLSTVNLLMRVGGFLSRRLGWVRLGRPLVVLGTRRAYPAIVRLVQETRALLAGA